MSRVLQGSQQAQGLKIGIVTARFNSEVTEKLETGALLELAKLGCTPEQIMAARVPGAFEVPLAAQALLDAGCDGVIALGAVIRGDTSHYDYVCAAVERGCSEVQLKYKKPVGFGILTTDNEDQALARAGGHHGNKGADTAQAVVEMIHLLKLMERPFER
jgi:6,7-dimethyl-8-ribityllumazine synthase